MHQATGTVDVRFQDLGLSDKTLTALEEVKYHTPSPVQAALLPHALKGLDCTGQAHTGTGKTAAFVIPILEQLDEKLRQPQALVLAPTRELSEQVSEEARRLACNRPCGVVCVVGGRPIRDQINKLRKGAQLVIGTPGRVLDLLSRRELDLRELKFVVLDEADRMLDIGFRPDIEKILRRCPKKRQTMLLSATVPLPVQRLAEKYMCDPVHVDLSGDAIATDSIEQYYVTVDPDRKSGLLARVLLEERPRQALVFMRTKRGADKLHRRFAKKLPQVEYLHGDLPQPKRDRVMKQFRDGKIRMLIATDVVGRGIDVSGISHIINYDIPEYCDDYVHRIGRVGRLSSKETGCAITFVTREQGGQLTNIEMRINRELQEYRIDGFEPYRPTSAPKHVNSDRRTLSRSFA